MAGLHIALFCLLAFLSKGSAQIRCYTVPSVSGELNCFVTTPNFVAATIEECCLENPGFFFEDTTTDESCTACIVFGFFGDAEVTRPEQGDAIIKMVGFIKGGNVQTLTAIDSRNTGRFSLTITGTATEGSNADFTIAPQSFEVIGPDATTPAELTTFIRIDDVALEPPEDYILTVVGRNNAGRAILAPTTPGHFVFPTLGVIIEDVEDAILQFTEIDYSNREDFLFIVPVVQLLTSIATELTVRIVPLSIGEVMERNLTSALPSLETFNPRAPNIATRDDDFSTTPVSITFPAGNAQTVVLDPGIRIVDDTINEAEQDFALLLELVDAVNPDRVDLSSARFVTVGRIFDNDPINIGFEKERYTVFEEFDVTGELIPIPIVKENNQLSELTFRVIAIVTLESGIGAARLDPPNADFSANPRVQREDFDPDELAIQYEFEFFDDSLPEPPETFQIQLYLEDEGFTSVNLGASGGSLFATATIVIIDDDDVIIGWEQNVTRVNESQLILELCVRVMNIDDVVEFSEGFEVSLAANTIQGTAADPGDYVALHAVNDLFTDIIANDTRRTCIEVVIVDDGLLEELEFFSIEVVPDPFVVNMMEFPSNVRLDPNVTFVEILDNDAVTIGFNQTEYGPAVEGTDNTVTVYVAVLEGALQRSVTVTFKTTVLGSNTATADADFVSLTRELTFDASTTVIPVEITINDDTIFEEFFENFTVSLIRNPDDPMDEVIVDPEQATVLIQDDEVVIIGWERNFTSQDERQSPLELCVRVLNIDDDVAFPEGFTVSLAANTIRGTAADPGDYTALQAATDLFFDIIDDNTRRTCVEVEIINDDLLEASETFSVEVVPDPFVIDFPSNVQLDPDVTFVEILDNDVAFFQFTELVYSANEADRFLCETIELVSGVLTFPISVTVVTNPSPSPAAATPAVDYDPDPFPGVLIFPEGSGPGTILRDNVTIVDDEISEMTEDFLLSAFITNPSNPASFVDGRDTATGLIIDNDYVTIGFEQTIYTFTEGVDASVKMCAIVMSGSLGREAIVTLLTTPGSATSQSPADYLETSVGFTFGPGINRRCVNVTIVNDVIVEDTENFFGNLVTTDTIITLDPDVAEVVILEDNTDRVTIGFEFPSYTATEGLDTSVELCTMIMGTLERKAVVDFETIDDTTKSPAPVDYTAASASFTYDAANYRRCIEVFIENDDILEAQEHFLGSLTTTDTAVILNPPETEVLINEDPNDSVTIGFEQTLYNATEGADSFVELLIEGTLERDAIVTFSTSDDSATSVFPVDYDAVTAQLTFDAINDRRSVDVIIVDDSKVENTENFFGNLMTLDPGVRLSPDRAEVQIFEDPNDGVTVGFEQTVYSATEGVDASVEICAVLTQGTLEREAVVIFSTNDSKATALTSVDYGASTQDLTFDGSTGRQCVTVPIINDDNLEDTESFTASLTTSDSAVTLNPDLARVDIFEDPNDALCPDPPAIVNGMRTFTGNSVGDTATYTCNSGFELIGDPVTTCTQVNDDSAAFPSVPPAGCRPLCPDPVAIVNGIVTISGNSVGDTATYTCDSGFVLIGITTTTCTQVDVNTAEFTPDPPVCRPLCPDPPAILNGMGTFTGNSIGDTATYTCDLGFGLIGITTTTCTEVDIDTAEFIPDPPVCRPLCPDPPAIVNGMRTFTGNSVRDTATYTCNSGFELIGDPVTTCTQVNDESAAFPSVPPPGCRPLCPDLPAIVNGMVTISGNSVGDTATYTCDPGFELIGVTTTTCTQVDVNTAVFSTNPPSCTQLGLNFNSTNYVVDEDRGFVTVCVVKTVQTGQDFMVTFTSSETIPTEAEADDDFTSGSVTLNLPANEMVVCTDIDITDDFLAMEGDERFMVEITVDDPDVVPGPPSTVTITDNDLAIVEFHPVIYTINEADEAVQFEVVRRTPTSEAVEVLFSTHQLSVTNVATSGVDYTVVTNLRVDIPPSVGEESMPVLVDIIDNNIAEGEEEFGAVLTLPAGSFGVMLGVSNATAVIIDDDYPGPISDVVWDSQSDSRVKVSWSAPLRPNGIVLEYNLVLVNYIGGRLLDSQTVDNSTFMLEFNSEELEAGVPYTFTIFATNIAGDGEHTTITNFTRELIPPAPRGVTIDRSSGTQMTVSWIPLTLEEARSLVPFYRIFYSPGSSNRKRQSITTCFQSPCNVPGSKSSVLIIGLEPSSSYSVMVVAVNGRDQEGEFSETIITQGQATTSSDNVIAIIGGVVAVVAVLLLIIGVIAIVALVLRYRNRRDVLSVQKHESIQLHEVATLEDPDVKVKDNIAYSTVPRFLSRGNLPNPPIAIHQHAEEVVLQENVYDVIPEEPQATVNQLCEAGTCSHEMANPNQCIGDSDKWETDYEVVEPEGNP